MHPREQLPPGRITFWRHRCLKPLDFFEDGKRDQEQWEAVLRLLGYTDVLDMLDYYFRGRLISEWDEIFYNDIAPLVFDGSSTAPISAILHRRHRGRRTPAASSHPVNSRGPPTRPATSCRSRSC